MECIIAKISNKLAKTALLNLPYSQIVTSCNIYKQRKCTFGIYYLSNYVPMQILSKLGKYIYIVYFIQCKYFFIFYYRFKSKKTKLMFALFMISPISKRQTLFQQLKELRSISLRKYSKKNFWYIWIETYIQYQNFFC